MITLAPVVCKAHIPLRRLTFINMPLDNYEGLKIICGDDHATNSYAKSIFDHFGERVDLGDNICGEATPIAGNTDEPNENATQPLNTSPPSSTSVRFVHQKKRSREANAPVIGHVIYVVDKVADAIKNPTHWSELLYERVMELDGFPDGLLLDEFDHL
ncbi:hypothetical protein J5N97_028329 [Dioscorea zingiberensis]|uniref:Uncharacterized protein n=1 Tax=Dioscorea zingiberensis TaxID=325984 RepID=A0A9D5BZ99_9LILI|nr:hypothetical protein J5N97_028329 [Dioscorea zingiberensis]